MIETPERVQLFDLHQYLERCEWAANVPPWVNRRTNALTSLFALAPVDPPSTVLGSGGYATQLRDILNREASFPAEEKLGLDRESRIRQLSEWLEKFPGFKWVESQVPVRDARRSFENIRKRRRNDPKFNDDVAEFRFWACAVWAAMMVGAQQTPSPDAKQRQRAVEASIEIGRLLDSTSLFSDAGLTYNELQSVRSILAKIVQVKDIQRRTRSDAHSSDRYWIELLTDELFYKFGDCPASLVCHLAPLKLRGADQTAIKKQVAHRKRELLQGAKG